MRWLKSSANFLGCACVVATSLLAGTLRTSLRFRKMATVLQSSTIDPLLYYIRSARFWNALKLLGALFGKISDQQLGFQKNRSTKCQLVLVVERLQWTLTDGGQVDAIFMDLSKAFDKVCHSPLNSKLQNLGAQDYIIRFLSGSLSCRQQRTIIDSSPSSLKPVTSGVPQGSFLGPLLFLAFINDLPARCTSVICLFSDDSVPHRRSIRSKIPLACKRISLGLASGR